MAFNNMPFSNIPFRSPFLSSSSHGGGGQQWHTSYSSRLAPSYSDRHPARRNHTPPRLPVVSSSTAHFTPSPTSEIPTAVPLISARVPCQHPQAPANHASEPPTPPWRSRFPSNHTPPNHSQCSSPGPSFARRRHPKLPPLRHGPHGGPHGPAQRDSLHLRRVALPRP